MLRAVVVLALAFAVLWYFMKPDGSSTRALDQQRTALENAEEVRAAAEDAAAEMAVRTDALRDETRESRD